MDHLKGGTVAFRPNPRRRRRLTVLASAVGLLFLWWGWQLPARADGSDVAQKLGEASGDVAGLSGSVGQNGGYGNQTHADFVPFLGGEPAGLLPGMFGELGPLSGFNGFSPPDGDDV